MGERYRIELAAHGEPDVSGRTAALLDQSAAEWVRVES